MKTLKQMFIRAFKTDVPHPSDLLKIVELYLTQKRQRYAEIDIIIQKVDDTIHGKVLMIDELLEELNHE